MTRARDSMRLSATCANAAYDRALIAHFVRAPNSSLSIDAPKIAVAALTAEFTGPGGRDHPCMRLAWPWTSAASRPVATGVLRRKGDRQSRSCADTDSNGVTD